MFRVLIFNWSCSSPVAEELFLGAEATQRDPLRLGALEVAGMEEAQEPISHLFFVPMDPFTGHCQMFVSTHQSSPPQTESQGMPEC